LKIVLKNSYSIFSIYHIILFWGLGLVGITHGFRKDIQLVIRWNRFISVRRCEWYVRIHRIYQMQPVYIGMMLLFRLRCQVLYFLIFCNIYHNIFIIGLLWVVYKRSFSFIHVLWILVISFLRYCFAFICLWLFLCIYY
jgi:hypothetical protein